MTWTLLRSATFACAWLAVVSLEARALPFSYGGRLVAPTQEPVAGPVDLELAFYTQPTGGTPVGMQVVPDVALVDGVFQTTIDLSEAEVAAIFGDPSLPVYLEVKDATHGKTYPRQRFSYVPYALRVPVDTVTIDYDAQGRLSTVGIASESYADTHLGGEILDQSAAAAGKVVKWNGTNYYLADDQLGAPGSGIQSLNGLNDSAQSLQIGTAGAEPEWATAGSSHVLNLPMASSPGVNAGLLSKTDYDAFAAKAQASHTHGNADVLAGIDATKIGAGTVDNTELGHLNGVTSSLQTQLSGKAAASHTHGDSDLTAGINATKIGGGTVDNTELGYLNGVTSALQSQLNGKAASTHAHSSLNASDGTPANAVLVDASGNVGVGSASPGAKLDVAGAVKARGGTAVVAPAQRKIAMAWIGNNGTTCFVQEQDGNWIQSVSRPNQGHCNLQLVNGTFSTASTLICICSAVAANPRFCQLPSSPTTLTVHTYTYRNDGVAVDSGFMLMCTGTPN